MSVDFPVGLFSITVGYFAFVARPPNMGGIAHCRTVARRSVAWEGTSKASVHLFNCIQGQSNCLVYIITVIKVEIELT